MQRETMLTVLATALHYTALHAHLTYIYNNTLDSSLLLMLCLHTHIYFCMRLYEQWSVPERAGPGPNDGQAVLWMYHSHYAEIADVYSGLAGPLVVYKQGTLDAGGMPTDVDKEFFILYQVSSTTAANSVT